MSQYVIGDDTAFITADFGNRYWKMMAHGDRMSATTTANLVAWIRPGEWELIRDRAKYTTERLQGTEIFGFRRRSDKKVSYVAAGGNAGAYGRTQTVTDEVRYDYDNYWGAVVCGRLLSVFPDGHNDIRMAVAHPVKSAHLRKTIAENTLGWHYVETIDGKRIKFNVTEVIPWDESVGGLVRWMESDYARNNAYHLADNDMIAVIDIGGGVTSFTQVTVQRNRGGFMEFVPSYNATLSPSIPMGVRTVMDVLAETLRTRHDAFLMMKRIQDNMLDQAIAIGKVRVSGDWVDVEALRDQAEGEFLDEIRRVWETDLEGGRNFQAVIHTGGGMHAYHTRLLEILHDGRSNVQPASAIEDIHFANLYGGDEIHRQYIQSMRNRAATGVQRRRGGW